MRHDCENGVVGIWARRAGVDFLGEFADGKNSAIVVFPNHFHEEPF